MKKTSFDKRPNVFVLLLFLCTFHVAALSAQHTTDRATVYYPEETEAAWLISNDTVEGFFELISNLDMHIQMGLDGDSLRNREEAKQAYVEFLKSDLSSFTQVEKKKLDRMMKEALENVEKLNPALLPESIAMIKTRGQAYGPSAFYTRNHAIMIPATAMLVMSEEELKMVLYHEIFHIISRQEPELRKQLYDLIGFRIVRPPVAFPEPLLERMLLNPDGLALPVIAEYKKGEETIWVAPLVFSRTDEYREDMPQFFNYMRFDLFVVEAAPGGGLRILSTPEGLSTAPPWAREEFRKAITDNTGYIIHPDEILADNFVILFLGPEALGKKSLSGPGEQLQEEFEQVLENFESGK